MLSENIAALRKAANETQNDLADALGVSNRTVSKWENGESEPDCRYLTELARHYRPTVDALLDFTPEPPSDGPISNEKAANACFDVLMSAEDETFGSVCYVYNPWYAIENLRDNIKLYGNGDMTEINALRKRILDRAPEAIERTAHAIALFFKPDGSASFGQNSTADTSVGMRVAVPGTNEGDVNGTLINMFGSLNHMMGVLGYDYVKPFGKAEYMVFINEINGLGTIIKDQVNSVVSRYTLEEFKADGNYAVKQEILKTMQELFGADFIVGVSFSSVNAQ